MKKAVNPWFLRDSFLHPLVVFEENEIRRALKENDIRDIIRVFVVPYVRKRPERYQEKLKETLAYYLKIGSQFETFFDDPVDISIIPPDPPRPYFEWVWEELYTGEDYKAINPDDYKVIALIEEPLMLSLPKK